MNDQEKREQEIIKEHEIKYPDHRTLAEMREDDEGQVKAIIDKDYTRHTFRDARKAGLFHIYCINKALEKLGIINPEKIPNKKTARKVFDVHNIKFEQREDQEKNWRNGIYIYKNNELAYFISRVLNYRTPKSLIFIPGRDTLARFSVITNAIGRNA